MKRSSAALVATSALTISWSVGLLGCSDDDSPVAPGNYRDPGELLQEHAAALEARDADRYAALLEAPTAGSTAGFRYYPPPDDVTDIPWMTGASWDYATEVDLIRNLSDPTYVSRRIGQGVQRIVLSFRVLDQVDLGDGAVRVTTVLDAQVLWSPSDGYACSVVLVMDLFPDADGYLRIRTVRESALGRVESPGWGAVKSRFRSEPVDFTDPTELVLAHAAFLEAKDLGGYGALLETAFEYVPQTADLEDFPWLTPEHPWDRSVELGIVRNMMDPSFVSQETGNSVESIDLNLAVTNQRSLDGGGTEVTSLADFQVMWAPNAGATGNVRLVFDLFPDPDGFLRIRRIQELPAIGRAGSSEDEVAVEDMSWAHVKALYR